MTDDGDYTAEKNHEYLYQLACGTVGQASLDLNVSTLAEIAADPSTIAYTAYLTGTLLLGEREPLPSVTPTCGRSSVLISALMVVLFSAFGYILPVA
jgi:hypothetical protein